MNNFKSNILLKEAIIFLLNEQILLEANKKKFIQDVVNNNIISKKEFYKKVYKKNNFRAPFKDDIFRDMLYNSCFYDQETWNVTHKF